jgi:hypothetical protein
MLRVWPGIFCSPGELGRCLRYNFVVKTHTAFDDKGISNGYEQCRENSAPTRVTLELQPVRHALHVLGPRATNAACLRWSYCHAPSVRNRRNTCVAVGRIRHAGIFICRGHGRAERSRRSGVPRAHRAAGKMCDQRRPGSTAAARSRRARASCAAATGSIHPGRPGDHSPDAFHAGRAAAYAGSATADSRRTANHAGSDTSTGHDTVHTHSGSFNTERVPHYARHVTLLGWSGSILSARGSAIHSSLRSRCNGWSGSAGSVPLKQRGQPSLSS